MTIRHIPASRQVPAVADRYKAMGVTPLTATEWDLLAAIDKRGFPVEFQKHLGTESGAAFQHLWRLDYITHNLKADKYITTPAGRAALDTRAEAER